MQNVKICALIAPLTVESGTMDNRFDCSWLMDGMRDS